MNNIKKNCSCCGTENIITVTDSKQKLKNIRYFDPSLFKHDEYNELIEECMECGYVSFDLSMKIDFDKSIIISPDYTQYQGNDFISRYSKLEQILKNSDHQRDYVVLQLLKSLYDDENLPYNYRTCMNLVDRLKKDIKDNNDIILISDILRLRDRTIGKEFVGEQLGKIDDEETISYLKRELELMNKSNTDIFSFEDLEELEENIKAGMSPLQKRFYELSKKYSNRGTNNPQNSDDDEKDDAEEDNDEYDYDEEDYEEDEYDYEEDEDDYDDDEDDELEEAILVEDFAKKIALKEEDVTDIVSKILDSFYNGILVSKFSSNDEDNDDHHLYKIGSIKIDLYHIIIMYDYEYITNSEIFVAYKLEMIEGKYYLTKIRYQDKYLRIFVASEALADIYNKC